MKKMSFILSAALAIVAIGMAVFAAQGSSSPYSDATGDISTNIGGGNPGGGILDIVSMEVSNTETDISFKLTVNGNISGAQNWGKYMIGIATGKSDGMLFGNGWNRRDFNPPNASLINLSLDNDPFASQIVGMNYWIGSWVDGTPTAQFWAWDGGNTGGGTDGAWQGQANVESFAAVAGATSQMTYTFPFSRLGLSVGDSFYFDAYSSGGGDNDGAIDALANPNVTVNDWNNASYTSFSTAFDGGTGLNSYTVVPIPEPSTIAMAAGAALGGMAMARRRKRAA